MDNAIAALIESMPEGFIVLDSRWCCTYVNAEAEVLLGLTREELLGKDPRALFAGFHADRSGPDSSLLDSAAVLFEVYQSGADRWLQFRVAQGRQGGAALFIRDVTGDIRERKRAHEALVASEQRFSRFMENLPGLAWIKDLDGRYVYVNAAAARAFRTEAEAVYGKRDDELFPPDTAAQFRSNDLRALADGGSMVVETLLHDDGVLHHSLVSKFPVTDPDGTPTGIGGMAVDITERVHVEEALRAADRRKDEFLAMLAHELRNPLAPIVTAAEIIRLRGDHDPFVQKQRMVIERQIAQMKRLLDDLLDVSRITRGKVELLRESVDLRSVVMDAAETSRPFLDRKSHKLEIALPDQPLVVLGDAARLCQILTNLLNNAATYTPSGGEVCVSVCREAEFGSVCVRDSGIGMTPEMLSRAFELFVQGERGLDRSPGGLGLGLTLVRELVERHGGTVTAHSAGRGLGSEFVVRLPLLK